MIIILVLNLRLRYKTLIDKYQLTNFKNNKRFNYFKQKKSFFILIFLKKIKQNICNYIYLILTIINLKYNPINF